MKRLPTWFVVALLVLLLHTQSFAKADRNGKLLTILDVSSIQRVRQTGTEQKRVTLFRATRRFLRNESFLR